MRIYTSLEELQRAEGRLAHPVVTLGNFDGLHRGHKSILTHVMERARAMSGTSVLITFEPHPLKVLKPDHAPALIKTRGQKMQLIETWKVDVVLEIPFTAEFAVTEAEDFVMKYLVEGLGAREVYIGEDFCFGKNRRGGINMLKAMGEEHRFFASTAPECTVEGQPVRSSKIRELLSSGQVEKANILLGRPYWVEGTTQPGHGRGEALGFGTANLKLVNDLIPGLGVYIAWVDVAGTLHPAVANLGYAPTFGDLDQPLLEVHLLGYEGNLHNTEMRVCLLHFIRPEKKFENVEALKKQIGEDVQAARDYFAGLPVPEIDSILP